MADNSQYGADISNFFETWTETAVKLWQDAGKSGGQHPFPFPGQQTVKPEEEKADEEDRYKAYRTWEDTWNTYASLMQLMMNPENQEEFIKGASTFTDHIAQATTESLENFVEFQTQLVENLVRATEHSKSHNFSTLDHKTFELFREYYKAELQKYLHVPKIGLPREFNEQLSELTDKSNIFYSHFAEFLYLLSVPLEKAQREMQKKFKAMVDSGEISTDSKQLYGEWVKCLEGHYMRLLQSPEYTNVLNNTIGSLADYKKNKQNVTNVFLKDMQIPTNSDMDEVYKELYTMKKKIRELNQKIEKLEQKGLKN